MYMYHERVGEYISNWNSDNTIFTYRYLLFVLSFSRARLIHVDDSPTGTTEPRVNFEENEKVLL